MPQSIPPASTYRNLIAAAALLVLLVLTLLFFVLFSIFGFSYPLLGGVIVGPIATVLLALAAYVRADARLKRMLHVAVEPAVARPGETVTGYVELRVERPTRFVGIEAFAWGGESVKIVVSSGKHTHTYQEEAPYLAGPLFLAADSSIAPTAGPTVTNPGTYRYRFSLGIPANALPSWRGSYGSVRCYVRARARITRGLDAIREVDIPILAVARAEERAARFGFGGATPADPTLRVQLETGIVGAGGTIRGQLVLSNPAGKTVRDVTIRLVERTWEKAQSQQRTTSRDLATVALPPPAASIGGAWSFELPVPPNARPSVAGRITSLRTVLAVRADIAFARDVKAEGEIVLMPPGARTGETTPQPF